MSFSNRIIAGLVLLAANAMPVAAQDGEAELYKAETIVTGTVEPERSRGFAAGALQVLVKLTGQPETADIPEAVELQKQAGEMVAEFSYEDRMKDIPVHDEQGTRERPHFLRIRFDQQKFDAAIEKAGFVKWKGKRPAVAVWLGVRDARREYILSRDGEDGYAQRAVFGDASKLRSIPVILPENAQTAVTFADIENGNRKTIEAYSLEHGADAVLMGLLEFDGNAYWNCRWSVHGQGVEMQWNLTGVTFDHALKGAIDRIMVAYAENARQQ